MAKVGEWGRARSAISLTNGATASEAFRAILQRLEDPNLPPTVRENVEQHFQNLASLAHNLKELGVDQKQINHHVYEIFEKYELALNTNMSRIKEIEESIVVCEEEVEL